MITYIIISIIAILFALAESVGLNKHGLLLGFFLTTILYALHYDFGNDYLSYYDWFLDVLGSDVPNTFDEFIEISRDPGWDMINYVFGKIFGEYGFFVLVAVIGCIESIAYYFLIKTYVPKQWYWLSMSIYTLTPSLFLQSFNVMRLSLVMSIFALLMPQLQQKKIIIPLIVTLLCYFIHGSSIILLPVILLSLIQIKPKPLAISSIILLVACFLLRDSFSEFFLRFANFSIGSRFEHYLEETDKNTFRLGYLIGLIPFYIIIIKLLQDKIDNKYYWIIFVWLIGIIIAPLSGVTTIIERLTYYFQTASVVVIPIAYSQVRNSIFRAVFIFVWFILAIIAIRSYMLPDSIFYVPYLKYQTIFVAL